MRETSLIDIRKRWEDGSMSIDEWNKAIEEHLARDSEMAGKVSAPPLEWDTTYSFPINERLITEDFIKRFANALGDPNPLYRDPVYGRTTTWGGMIAPPTFDNAIASAGYFPLKPEIPGVIAFYGGTDHKYFKVIRPGDEFRVVNKYLGAVEKTRLGRPYRLFDVSNQRIYINQREETVAIATAHEMISATPPGKQKDTTENRYAGRVRHRYTAEELDAIHHGYDEMLQGKTRRGAEIRFWEDVVEGEETKTLIEGPLDVSDIVAYTGATSTNNQAFAIKWRAMKSDLGRCLIDPETGASHNPIDWHYLDSMAQVAGLPYAHSSGRQNEGNIGHLISDWMGDAGFVKLLNCSHRNTFFHGDTAYTHGKVIKKYVEDGDHLIELEAWSETQDHIKFTIAYATVKLVSKKD